HAAKAVADRAVERIERVGGGVLVARLVPGAAEDVALAADGVAGPLLDVAREVVGAVFADADRGADDRRPRRAEVAVLDDIRERAICRGGPSPVMHRGQPLAGVLGERGGFVPAHTLHGKVVLTLRIRTEAPGRRAGLPGGVAHGAERVFPGQLVAILD